METKDIADLKPNPKNARKIGSFDKKNLEDSIKRYGDLSCIVFNVRSKQLVCGHQRMEAFKAFPGEKRLVIEQSYATPNQQGTVAEGKLWYDNENYKYREVDWDEGDAAAAGLAANHIQGDDDKDMLAEVTYDLSLLDNGAELLASTGQSQKQIENLLKSVGVDDNELPDETGIDPKESDKREFRATVEQWETIDEAIEHIKSQREIPAEENGSKNGSAFYYMSRDYLDRLHGESDVPQPAE